MKKQEKEQQEKYEIDDFEKHCHLWNIVPGGNDNSGNAIVMLRKIIDSIHSNPYANPHKQLPSFLIAGETGTGKKLVAKAIVNSLAITDVRECHSKYFGIEIPSFELFRDSLGTTAHIIDEIEKLRSKAESTLWKDLTKRECSYYNNVNRSYDIIVHCNGLIIMTCNNMSLISDTLIDATDHIIRLNKFTLDQLESVVHQRLVFCDIEYAGEEVLQAIVDQGAGQIGQVIDFLKICLMLLKAELKDDLTMEIVEKAKKLSYSPVPLPPIEDDIPF